MPEHNASMAMYLTVHESHLVKFITYENLNRLKVKWNVKFPWKKKKSHKEPKPASQ